MEPRSEDFVPTALRDWVAIHDLAEAASRAFDQRQHAEGRRLLSVLYSQGSQAAEEELISATGAEPSRQGRRGKMPRLEWRPIIKRDTKIGDHELSLFSWLHAEWVALRGMLRNPGDSLERARCLRRLGKAPSHTPEQVEDEDGIRTIDAVSRLGELWDGFTELPVHSKGF